MDVRQRLVLFLVFIFVSQFRARAPRDAAGYPAVSALSLSLLRVLVYLSLSLSQLTCHNLALIP